MGKKKKILSRRLIVSKNTPISVIVQALTRYGCQDLTAQLDSTSYTAQPLLRGGYGDVYRGILLTQTPVAIKALRLPVDPDDELGKIPKRAARELYTWSRCNHPNVLPLLGLATLQDQLRMVSSWMVNGSLPDYLEKHPNLNRYEMCTQICLGLEYLHSVPMIHGDMKGQNVLVSDEGVPMITDFGNAVLEYGDLQFTQTKNVSGFTPRWTAPELLIDEDVTQSSAADVYALGMTILEIITGDVPYTECRNEMKLIFAIGSKNLIPKRPEIHIPSTPRGDALWSLLIKCWNSDAEQRPSAHEVAQIMKQMTDGSFDDAESKKPEEV